MPASRNGTTTEHADVATSAEEVHDGQPIVGHLFQVKEDRLQFLLQVEEPTPLSRLMERKGLSGEVQVYAPRIDARYRLDFLDDPEKDMPEPTSADEGWKGLVETLSNQLTRAQKQLEREEDRVEELRDTYEEKIETLQNKIENLREEIADLKGQEDKNWQTILAEKAGPKLPGVLQDVLNQQEGNVQNQSHQQPRRRSAARRQQVEEREQKQIESSASDSEPAEETESSTSDTSGADTTDPSDKDTLTKPERDVAERRAVQQIKDQVLSSAVQVLTGEVEAHTFVAKVQQMEQSIRQQGIELGARDWVEICVEFAKDAGELDADPEVVANVVEGLLGQFQEYAAQLDALGAEAATDALLAWADLHGEVGQRERQLLIDVLDRLNDNT